MKVLKGISGSNVAYVLSSQGITIIVNLIMTIGVAKVLGINDFGYWQLFLLYVSYTGFFHLGIFDGVYLRYGGKRMADLDLLEVRSVFWSATSIQLLLLLLTYLIFLKTNFLNEGLVVPVLITAFLTNTQFFLYFVLLATNNISKYSKAILVEKGFFILAIFFYFFNDGKNFQVLIYIYGIGKILSISTLMNFFSFLFNRLVSFPQNLLLKIFQTGVLLMLANVTGAFILGIPRLFIEDRWGIEVFGKVSLAFSTIFFFIVLFSQLSLILFPVLRNKNFFQQKESFLKLRDVLSRTLMLFFILYFPLSSLLSFFMPTYEYSFVIFYYLLPIVIFDGLNQILYLSYFKTLNLQKKLLGINIIVVLFQILLIYTSFYFFENVILILLITVLSILLRSYLCELTLSKLFKISSSGSFIFEVIYSFLLISLHILGVEMIFIVLIAFFAILIHYKFRGLLLFVRVYEK
ncbi:hypothetical protein [Arcticibacterium luteifluviistationis]|uniref:Polysaccharide biosynthesis protein n=1 Tax=Arcticibacterium luteifluviistationis TaxID=1784714 RepID=A0A2Z4GGC2_9BACT|nr:hypothetical protein [Arcticibacterium luteifluviistationis]AWV99843.1 hypothetical protein DJ013_17360 [Arcticibacterium luteifluviistationis]